MKMEPIVSSETSVIRTQTPGNYPKRNKLQKLMDFLVRKSCGIPSNGMIIWYKVYVIGFVVLVAFPWKTCGFLVPIIGGESQWKKSCVSWSPGRKFTKGWYFWKLKKNHNGLLKFSCNCVKVLKICWAQKIFFFPPKNDHFCLPVNFATLGRNPPPDTLVVTVWWKCTVQTAGWKYK